ncbi:MAG TPA: ADP-ribosylglycohydrolase family protein [Planctomycetota bacterium]|nr:ADP-ribosylglycohydrolase family protein [Planctomycetota bacterium]
MKSALSILLLMSCAVPAAGQEHPVAEMSAEDLEDRIRGGLLGEIFGNLNGLPHEMKYIAEPGKVESYTPSLPKGAWTDDDTDIEWVYLWEMERSGELYVPPKRIAELWRANMNKGIWCANLYARQLLDLGIEPPVCGRIAVNPWSVFNISAQFVSEAFGLISPGMPRSAAKIGIHYTHYAVDGEPIQTTQLFTAMIATAFFERDMEKIVRAGLAAVDPKSAIHPIVTDVLGWWKENPKDWKETRKRIKEKYTHYGGGESDRNGYELNTAAVIGALLHGGGDDLKEILRLAFNFGWDADCNAAICGAIVGVLRGKKWIDAQGWEIKDVYKNTCRDEMPKDETITGYGDKLIAAARKHILANGGQEATVDGRKVYRIRLETPANVEPLPEPLDRLEELRKELGPQIEKELSGAGKERARAAYLALALGEAERLKKERPEDWKAALEELIKFPNVLRQIYDAPQPQGARIQAAAKAEGLEKPRK